MSLFPQGPSHVNPEFLQFLRQGLRDKLRGPTLSEAAAGQDIADALDRCPILAGCVHQPLREQLQACRGLRAIAHDLLVDAALIGPEDDEVLSNLLDARAYNFYEAGLVLAHRGYGEQALVVARSLFETMLDQHWVANNPRLAAPRWTEHSAFWQKDLERKAAVSAGRDLPKFSDEEAREQKRLRQEYGKSFTGLSTGEKVALLERADLRYGIPERHVAELRRLADVVLHEANLRMHTSAYAEDAVAMMVASPLRMFELGAAVDLVPRALHLASWTYLRSVHLLVRRQYKGGRAFAHAERMLAEAMATVPAERMASGKPTASCPCGSGRQVRDCHGRRAIDEDDLNLAFALINEDLSALEP
jgi:hypothetical protein